MSDPANQTKPRKCDDPFKGTDAEYLRRFSETMNRVGHPNHAARLLQIAERIEGRAAGDFLAACAQITERRNV